MRGLFHSSQIEQSKLKAMTAPVPMSFDTGVILVAVPLSKRITPDILSKQFRLIVITPYALKVTEHGLLDRLSPPL